MAKTKAKELDQFYTNPKIAKQCYDIVKDTISRIYAEKHQRCLQYIEPSAGTGAFYDILPSHNITNINGNPIAARLGFDIDPKMDTITKMDFLKDNIDPDTLVKYEKRVIIGNPPFGKKGKLAIEFLNRSMEIAPLVGFILPIQFTKWSIQNKIPKEYVLLTQYVLEKNIFTHNDNPIGINCCFQIWYKSIWFDDLRIKQKPITSHADFEMWQYNCTKNAEAYFKNDFDFAVLRQGYGDYTDLKTNQSECSRKKQWILFKANNATVLKRLKNINFTELSNGNTTTPGFGKADVVKYYTEKYK